MKYRGDRKANITAAFGCDMILEGTTTVPNLLLKYYTKLGITDREMMLIIQMIFLNNSHHCSLPTNQQLAALMEADESQVRADLAALMEKGIINIGHGYSEELDDIVPTYCLEPLFEKISELWACHKVALYQKMKKNLKEQEPESRGKDRKKVFAAICRAFEKEFARLLSPMEMEQVNLWLDDFNGQSDLILEALKKSVLLGKHNFKYIDSILLDWQRNNLKTVSEVAAFETSFRERQASKSLRRKGENASNKKDKFRLLYLG